MPIAILQAAGLTITIDTRANILASTPTGSALGFATDTNEFFIYNSGWFVAPLELQIDDGTPDMGLQPPTIFNDRAGYSDEYITDKSIYNSRLLGSVVEEEGSIRTSNGTFQIYLNSTWNDVVINFRFREQTDDEGGSNYQLEHNPIGLDEWYEVLSGNSDQKGLNGLPITQNYHTDMGAYQTPIRVQGRSFS